MAAWWYSIVVTLQQEGPGFDPWADQGCLSFHAWVLPGHVGECKCECFLVSVLTL